MTELQKAKEEYDKNMYEQYVRGSSCIETYVKLLEKSNAEMLEVLISIRSELFPHKGNPTKDHPDIVDILVNRCDRAIEKAKGQKIEEVLNG